MGQYADKAKKMSTDPGVVWLGQVADDLAAAISDLQKKYEDLKVVVDGCCGDTIAARLAASSASDAKSTRLPEGTTPPDAMTSPK